MIKHVEEAKDKNPMGLSSDVLLKSLFIFKRV